MNPREFTPEEKLDNVMAQLFAEREQHGREISKVREQLSAARRELHMLKLSLAKTETTEIDVSKMGRLD